MRKSSTDMYWNERAASVANDVEVNIMDIFQRELEYDYVGRYLSPEMIVLEAGCGNGFSTARFRPLVKHVDGFDYAENMILRAKETVGETNNCFFHDDVLDLQHVDAQYDTAICVRVLINLRNLEDQKTAVRNLAGRLKPGGHLILLEGFKDGFKALSDMRASLGMPPVEPAKINFYCWLEELMPDLERSFEVQERFHLGAYDYLTRVVYPMVAGLENVRHNTVFSEKCYRLAQQFNPDDYEPFSRVKGLVCRRR